MELSGAMLALLPPVLVVAAFLAHRQYRRWRESRLITEPFPDTWRAQLQQNMHVYSRLNAQEQDRLHTLIKLFLDEKTFYGCAGLQITDEIRLTIAAEACLLALYHRGKPYPRLTAILVYPSAFSVRRERALDDGTVSDAGHHVLGESWDNGRVILSWDDVEHGVSDFSDGQNVVLHEFAHQLDAASGSTNGAPPLRQNSYKSWASVLSENFEDLRRRSSRGRHTVIDQYGATNPAEFFAVATETFFEQPHQLFDRRPELYEELSQYYQVDPRKWADVKAPPSP